MPRSILILLAAVSSALLLTTAPAVARQRALTDQQKTAMQERLKAADANADGLIDREEAQASLPRLAKRFDALDANDDGKLSPEELRAAGQKFAQRRGR
jgi:Ca2+-binding EF-hand superfamily protein